MTREPRGTRSHPWSDWPAPGGITSCSSVLNVPKAYSRCYYAETMNPAAYAVIDVAAVRHNLAVIRQHAPGAKIMAVIKANAYGHGALRVAHALQDADGFAVARVDEGIRLRNAGIRGRIAVLEGFTCAEDLDQLSHYQLEAVVHCAPQIEILSSRPGKNLLSVWLKLDTGMNRLGFKSDEFTAAHQTLTACDVVKQPINLMTHLANADDLDDPMTGRQIQLFKATVAGLPGERSIANSAGIFGWPNALSDWVRPGITLYGISPFPEKTGADFHLKPIMGLYSRLIAVKHLRPGDSVGYGGSWVCRQATLMGIAAIGYGDGYPRQARSGTPLLVNGGRVPLIGRVSMDMVTVDLASQPQAKPGDLVTLWGCGLPVEEVASHADTIPYTLVCGITQRVQIVEHVL